MSMNDFQILAKLGQGAYSSVYKVKRLVDESIYALKKVKLLHLSNRQIHNAVNQVRILASIRHPNIVGYKEAFYDPPTKSLCIVMEYADGGDLLQKIFDCKKRGIFFKEEEIWDIFIQIVKGLAALHDLKILHRDIKSANVFLCKNGVAKLGDMNVSKVVRKEAMCQTQTGTPYYASPEVWHDQPYDARSDIWSLGCVLYEFINLKPPFRARDMEGLFKKVTRGYYSRINKGYSDDLSQLLKQLLKVNPKERINCKEILELAMVKNKQKKVRQIQMEEKSILLKTIKITKNINYLTQKLPKPNYSPLRMKSLQRNKSTFQPRKKSPYDLQLSLPPIKSNKKVQKLPIKSQRVSPKQRHESLPKIVSKRYLKYMK